MPRPVDSSAPTRAQTRRVHEPVKSTGLPGQSARYCGVIFAKNRLWTFLPMLLSATLCLAGLLAADRLHAAEIESVVFADELVASDTKLDVFGVGLMRYRYFIKAYVAALYMPGDATAEDVFDDETPRRLELHYFYSIDGKGFGDAALEVLERMLSATEMKALESRLERLSSLYVSVKPGDRYSLTYLPGVGTELSLNGKPLGTIPGADFAAEYFKIWLGDKPISEGLREQLLRLD
jgi:hypothetical protein